MELLTAIKTLIYDEIDDGLVLTKFLLNVLNNSGYGLNFSVCGSCNMPIVGDIVLSSVSNEFSCVSCSNNHGLPVSKREFNNLKIISNSNWNNLKSIKISKDILELCVKILKYDIQNVFNHKFISF